MPSTNSLLSTLKADYPDITFAPGKRFYWSPDTRTVFYDAANMQADVLLHELGHGLLKHREYTKDVELIAMESDAWDTARTLAATYAVPINDDDVEDTLDTYREWLHARSTCPECEATGYQTAKFEYACVACDHRWRVNEARLCALRRYSVS